MGGIKLDTKKDTQLWNIAENDYICAAALTVFKQPRLAAGQYCHARIIVVQIKDLHKGGFKIDAFVSVEGKLL